ncbi:MAG: hypothetical protein MRJ92_10095 [Nitrospira sp.]|nr:hypothetical protein [Nitrospira sp.]
MPEQAVLNVDLADVWRERGRKRYIRTIAWGDEITVVKQAATYLEVSITVFREKPDGSILPNPSPATSNRPKPLVSQSPT